MPTGIFKHKLGRNASHWTGGKTEIVCKFCRRIFFKHLSNKRKFCSRICYEKWQRKEGGKVPGSFQKGHKSGFPKGYIPWNKGKNEWGVIVKCASCSKQIRIKKYRTIKSKKNFCSHKCNARFYRWGGWHNTTK